jgi:UDP-N-acetylglucosamine 2-epimerase (non-hydrolysing)
MDRIIFEQLKLDEVEYNLNVGSGTHGKQTAAILTGIEEIFLKDRPDVVLVQGDTNSVLAGALAGAKMGIPIGHVEAGLRSFDRNMPEELNRVMADHLSELLFATSVTSKANLLREGIPESRIHITGNTIVDAVKENLRISEIEVGNVLPSMGLQPNGYILSTLHRQENVDDRERLSSILVGLNGAGEGLDMEVILPMHPRTKKNLQTFGLKVPPRIRLIDPVGFLEFLQLESNALVTLTDSGGVQEESCILGVHCVTLRDNTERPETVDVGANVIAGTDSYNIARLAVEMARSTNTWNCPLGDGTAAKRIIDIVLEMES